MEKTIIITNKATVKAEGKMSSGHCKKVAAFKADGSELHFFTSIEDAAEKLGINANYISVCKEKKICKGWWIYNAENASMLFSKMAPIINNVGADAKAYREIKAAEEAKRLAEQKRKEALEKAEAHRERRKAIYERMVAETNRAYDLYMQAEKELQAMREEENIA